MTRVLFLIATLDGGGAQRTVLTVLPHLHARGLDARVGLFDRRGALDDDLVPSRVVTTRVAPAWMSYAPSPGLGRMLTGIGLVPLQQLDLLRQFRPHVMISCTVTMNLAALVSARAYGRRRVAWILREGNNTRAMLENEVPGRLGRAARWWATRIAYRAPDHLLTISEGVAAGLVRDFGVRRDRVRVVPNPVEVARVSRLAHERNGTPWPRRFIAACGRLDRQKGFDLLLQAFARLPDTDLALVILGEGPERGRLEALAGELGIGPRLLMPGFVRNPWACIARAAVFVLSSRWEGFASVLVEAMACGTPVVATDCEWGPREIVRDGEAGLLVRVDDPDSLAAAINRVLADGALGGELAARGRQRAMDFDAPAIGERYANLIHEAAARGRAGTRSRHSGGRVES
jgi:glycosyltransferase involved in cell wall biosynthesis